MKYLKTFLNISLCVLSFSVYAQEADTVEIPFDNLEYSEIVIPDFTPKEEVRHDHCMCMYSAMPEYIGPSKKIRKLIRNNTKYPKSLKKQKIEGRVVVSFIVTKDGQLKDIHIKRSVHPWLDQEAMRIVKSTKGQWKAGEIKGEVADGKRSMLVEFRLKKKNNKKLKPHIVD